jgi:arsenate reductase
MTGPTPSEKLSAMSEDVTMWFNPSCSKCRGAREILDEDGIDATYVDYLRDAPTRAELERVLTLLGESDPKAITRTGETRYAELSLDDADRDALLEALAANPILIERPIVIRGGRAVIGRPPERVRELFE